MCSRKGRSYQPPLAACRYTYGVSANPSSTRRSSAPWCVAVSTGGIQARLPATEDEDAMRPEAGRVGQRRGFVGTAAAGERVEVAARGTGLPLPPPRFDQLLDAELAEPLGLRTFVDEPQPGRVG